MPLVQGCHNVIYQSLAVRGLDTHMLSTKQFAMMHMSQFVIQNMMQSVMMIGVMNPSRGHVNLEM